jgi:hypothetical protein
MPFIAELSNMKFSEMVTLVGAVVAGITGIFNLAMLAKNRFDRIKVGFGPSSPDVNKDRVYCLHVINFCDHAVKIADYGYIKDNYEKESMAYTLSNQGIDVYFNDIFYPSSTTLKHRGDEMDAGYETKGKVIAVYARTNMQSFLRIGFSNEVTLKDKVNIYWKFIRPKNRY